jgi:hypothetical protein
VALQLNAESGETAMTENARRTALACFHVTGRAQNTSISVDILEIPLPNPEAVLRAVD